MRSAVPCAGDDDQEEPEAKPPAPDDTAEGEKKEEEEAEDPDRPLTFVERYAGPVGTTVTIQQTPQPPFGLPGLPPMPGPSISIRNPGRGQRPQVRIFVGSPVGGRGPR